MASPSWLDALHYHAVFSPVSDAPAASTSSSASTATPRQRLALLRANELLVAVGHQLRIASLTEAKSRAVEGKQGSYKVRLLPPHLLETRLSCPQTLITPAIDFSIDSLVVNPASKLVAVVGQQRVVVVVLPRKGWTGVVGDTIECRAIEVGRGQLGDVAQVRWHPWSTNGATLLVLTTDGQLLEYDVADDADRPVQTLDFCSGAGTSFDASFDLDEEAETAVSFCFGSGGGDWGALTVYGLMADGTIYSLCPYLPKAACVWPPSILLGHHADVRPDLCPSPTFARFLSQPPSSRSLKTPRRVDVKPASLLKLFSPTVKTALTPIGKARHLSTSSCRTTSLDYTSPDKDRTYSSRRRGSSRGRRGRERSTSLTYHRQQMWRHSS